MFRFVLVILAIIYVYIYIYIYIYIHVVSSHLSHQAQRLGQCPVIHEAHPHASVQVYFLLFHFRNGASSLQNGIRHSIPPSLPWSSHWLSPLRMPLIKYGRVSPTIHPPDMSIPLQLLSLYQVSIGSTSNSS